MRILEALNATSVDDDASRWWHFLTSHEEIEVVSIVILLVSVSTIVGCYFYYDACRQCRVRRTIAQDNAVSSSRVEDESATSPSSSMYVIGVDSDEESAKRDIGIGSNLNSGEHV